MATFSKKARTGFVGEFFIYSELVRREVNCFITLGNAKSVDLIVVDKNKKAHFVDVKTSSTLMKNYHKHDSYAPTDGSLSRWQISIRPFWESHKNNPNPSASETADYYIFHSLSDSKRNVNYIVSGEELVRVMHRKIDGYLTGKGLIEIDPKHICNWDICELCFDNCHREAWEKIPK